MEKALQKDFSPTKQSPSELIKDYTCIIEVATSLYNLFMEISHSFLRDRGII